MKNKDKNDIRSFTKNVMLNVMVLFFISIQGTQCTLIDMANGNEEESQVTASKSSEISNILFALFLSNNTLCCNSSLPVSVTMPSFVFAVQTCGLVCGYQYDYVFSVRNNLSESISVAKIYQEYLSTPEDSFPICSSTWENGTIATKNTCGLQTIAVNSVNATSLVIIPPNSSVPFSINNAGYSSMISYIRITATYKKSSSNLETVSAIVRTRF